MAESGDQSTAFIDFFAIDESNSKRQRQEEEGVDRITNLPETVLCHILSFLPTKFAIEAGQVTKRWKDQWPLVKNFEFDDSLHSDGLSINKPKSFTKFGDKVFSLSSVRSLRKFHLKCLEIECNVSDLHNWICLAVARNPEQIDVEINVKEPFVLSESVFTCQTLAVLKLNALCTINLSALISVPYLKTLHLHSVKFVVDDPMKTIFAGCPILEELLLEGVTFDNLQTLSFRSVTLRKLYAKPAAVPRRSSFHTLIIDAPQLQSLFVEDYCLKGFHVNEMPLLCDAIIRVSRHRQGSGIREELPGVFEVLRNISNVKYMKLAWNAHLGPLNSFHNMLLTFSNLKYLEIKIFRNWQLMTHFLECSHNLKYLVCEMGCRCSVNREPPRRREPSAVCMWHPQNIVPKCLSGLTSIEISLNGCIKEIDLVGYLLKNSTLLKKMRIRRSQFFVNRWKKNILREILRFPRGSIACKVEFSQEES